MVKDKKIVTRFPEWIYKKLEDRKNKTYLSLNLQIVQAVMKDKEIMGK